MEDEEEVMIIEPRNNFTVVQQSSKLMFMHYLYLFWMCGDVYAFVKGRLHLECCATH